MEIKRITAVLACILALACAAVAAVIVSVNRKINHLPATAVDDMVEILSGAGIDIDADIIETKREKGEVYIFDSDNYYETVASLLVEDAISEKFATPNGEILLYEGGALLEFGSGFYFRYSLDGVKHTVPEKDSYSEHLSPSTAEYKRIADAAIEFLENGSREFSLGKAISIVTSVDAVYGEGENYYAVCSRTMDGVSITDNTVTCTYRNGVITGAEGTWCFLTKGESHSAQLVDQLNILFNAKNDITVPEAKRVEITSIGRCYSLYYYGEGDDFCLIPCRLVSTDEAGDFIYNALNGKLYTKK